MPGQHQRAVIGSIPACAGEPYPDGCPFKVSIGLSPRVRGNPGWWLWGKSNWRSIPACAGEPIQDHENDGSGGVYPRVCGGTKPTPRGCCHDRGLSPRVRGNRWSECRYPMSRWSIPACAGEPVWASWETIVGEVYPRVCGGTRRRPASHWPKTGLSPRVRGNPAGDMAGAGGRRSIPACAGEPPAFPRPRGQWGVYPRVCGGTTGGQASAGIACGLSPRVRGNRVSIFPLRELKRSIPACAGEPLSCGRWAMGRKVYPRVCGGTEFTPAGSRHSSGLSPRVRGNPDKASANGNRPRSIPACAGGTQWGCVVQQV